jgi:signal transduction histidine kinase
LLELLDLYQTNLPKVPAEIEEKIEDIDLEYLREDLTKILSSMKTGSDRIRDVVLGLRTFSRLDEAEIKRIDIHTNLDSTLMILQHRLNNINLIKQYGKLPLVKCYAGDLNQVFFNILDNSIYALSLSASPTCNQKINSENQTVTMPTILVATEQINQDSISIKIQDNGPGIPQALCEKIFEPFFTTKPVGSGKGLGLSISHQIIVEKHHGQLICHSSPGNGAEFTIILPIQAD